MTKISRRLAQVVNKELSKNILPVKTSEGILVGDVLIVSDANLKHLRRNDHWIYKDIYLNIAAIKLANLLAIKQCPAKIQQIYQADQEYGTYYQDSQQLRAVYEKAVKAGDFDRADIFWARYTERKDRAQAAKKRLEALVMF
jgi:hypothetical protein